MSLPNGTWRSACFSAPGLWMDWRSQLLRVWGAPNILQCLTMLVTGQCSIRIRLPAYLLCALSALIKSFSSEAAETSELLWIRVVGFSLSLFSRVSCPALVEDGAPGSFSQRLDSLIGEISFEVQAVVSEKRRTCQMLLTLLQAGGQSRSSHSLLQMALGIKQLKLGQLAKSASFDTLVSGRSLCRYLCDLLVGILLQAAATEQMPR